jgi:hypothetical protein
MTKQTLFSEDDLLNLYKRFERNEVGYDKDKPKHYPCVVVMERRKLPGYKEFHFDFEYVYLSDFK